MQARPSWQFSQSTEPVAKLRGEIAGLIDFAKGRCERFRQTAHWLKSLRVGELQMDWLRSEDLKEEKSVTAPWLIVAVEAHCVLSLSGGVGRHTAYH